MPVVAGALVEVFQYGELVDSGTTDSEGKYEKELPIGTYFVRVSKAGYRTHTYMLEFLEQSECVVLNLPINPLEVMSLQAVESMSEDDLLVTTNPTVVDEMTLNPSVTLLTQDPFFAISQSAAVQKSPTTWTLRILPPFCDDGGLAVPASAISPAAGDINSGSGVTVTTIGTTKQFLLFYCSYLHGTQVNVNSANYELVDTTHQYIVAAQTLGSNQELYVLFP